MVFPGRTGVLVLRVWTEDEQTIRARISSMTNVGTGPPSTTVAQSIEDIDAILTAFLEAFTPKAP